MFASCAHWFAALGTLACGQASVHARLSRRAEVARATVTGCSLSMQRLELLATMLLVRQRQPLADTASGLEHAFGAAVLSLPSGLLTLIGEALTKIESQLEARAALLMSAHRLRCTVHGMCAIVAGAHVQAKYPVAATREAKRAELSALGLTRLKELCEQHGVRKKGTKAKLLARLCDALSAAWPATMQPRTERATACSALL